MIRVFSESGNVLAGVVNNSIDLSDYKGDKSWFKDGLNLPEETYYISPNSIARRTQSPAIRILRPIFVEGEVFGIFVINFQLNIISKIFVKFNLR